MKQLKLLESMIFTIRNHKVIIDADLAALYDVPTKALNQAVKRNEDRFPRDFVFRLTEKERLEVVTNCDHLTKLNSLEPCLLPSPNTVPLWRPLS